MPAPEGEGPPASFRLQDFLAVSLELNLRIPQEAFDVAAFTAGVPGGKLGEGPTLLRAVAHPRPGSTGDFHVHLEVTRGAKEFRARLGYYQNGDNYRHETDDAPPFAEDVSDWLCRYLAGEHVRLASRAEFEFPSPPYRSALGIPIPISPYVDPTPSHVLSGAEIRGVILDCARSGGQFRSAMQSVGERSVDMGVFGASVELTELRVAPRSILAQLAQVAQAMVRKSES